MSEEEFRKSNAGGEMVGELWQENDDGRAATAEQRWGCSSGPAVLGEQ